MKVRGFTLLEVMVAVAILGLGLTVILGSQMGLFSGSSRSKNLTLATNLARCKMSEIEEKLLRDGYPITEQTDEGDCCAEELSSDYRCSWKVQPIKLPEINQFSDGGAPETDTLGPLSKLASFQDPSKSQGFSSASPEQFSKLTQELGSAPSSGIGPFLMAFVYPQLKPMLEASIRKLIVTVQWKEGKNAREFSVTQYVTDPRQGQLDVAGMMMDGGTNLLQGLGNPFGTAPTSPSSRGP